MASPSLSTNMNISTFTARSMSRIILYNIHTFVVEWNIITSCVILVFCCPDRVMSKAQHFPRSSVFFDAPVLHHFRFIILIILPFAFLVHLSLPFSMTVSQFCRTYDHDTTHGISPVFTSSTGYRVARRYRRYGYHSRQEI